MDNLNNQPAEPQGNRFRSYWPLLAELWIAATILAFFITRILGSAFVRNMFSSLAGR
jgi:hypothetical protein